MRDRLIELLNDMQDKGYISAKNEDEISCHVSNKNIADYLLKNGVFIQPCEVYKDVYLIIGGIVERCTVEGIYYTRKKNYVRLRPYHQEYLGNWSKYYTPSLRHFGKTVFLTREEAEQALKGGKE